MKDTVVSSVWLNAVISQSLVHHKRITCRVCKPQISSTITQEVLTNLLGQGHGLGYSVQLFGHFKDSQSAQKENLQKG